jgi:hypothetical protein
MKLGNDPSKKTNELGAKHSFASQPARLPWGCAHFTMFLEARKRLTFRVSTLTIEIQKKVRSTTTPPDREAVKGVLRLSSLAAVI